MSDHMSAKDYQKLIVNKEKDDGAMSDEEFQKTLKNQQLDYANKINNKPRNHEEDDITKQVAEYLEVLQLQKKVVLFSHIPQETFTKSWVTKNKNKAMGVRAGVPDMVIVFPYKVLFLELKRLKGGKVSDAQQAWIDAINNIDRTTAYAQGSAQVLARVACGFVEAKDIIDQIIDN